LAIGNFDGLHRGHQRIIRRLFREAKSRDLPAYLLTFAPHPEKTFSPDRILMIQTLDQRLSAIHKLRIEAVAVLPFTRAFARITAESFIENILAAALKARVVVVGADFRFGRDRRGDAALLENTGRSFHFKTSIVSPLIVGGAVVSSSLIRELLVVGQVDRAARLLGRFYEIEGEVVRGEGRGRTLGFPTANVISPSEILPPGVFATWLFHSGKAHPSITNIGCRPTFGEAALTVETHILDDSPNLYGASIRLSFLHRLREERVFSGTDALTDRIRKDIAAARRIFRGLCP